MARLWSRFAADRRGTVAVMSATMMVVVIGLAAFGVDIGNIFLDKRRAQSAADLAAIVAASNLSNATNAASATVQQNAYAASALTAVVLGTYTANAAVAPSQRFVSPATGTPNAVQVTLQTQSPLIFGKVLVGVDAFPISATATATSTALANFAIGSRLVSLNGGLVNAILGSMLGTTISLSAMDYQSLVSTNIDAFDYMNALATRLSLTGITYNQLLATNVKEADLLQALVTAQKDANGYNATTLALNQIAQAVSGNSTSVVPQSLISAGPYGSLIVGQNPRLGVAVSAFGLLSAIAELANGTHQVSAALNFSLPGITAVTLLATIGERPVGSSWVAVGASGATVTTAQTRVLLTIQLGGSGGIATVTLPLYVEVATGTATLTSLTCGYPNVSTSTATLGVTPGIVNAWIGSVSASDLANLSTPVNPPPATLANVAGLTVTGLANAYMGNTTPTSVSFSYSDIQSGAPKTVTTTNFTRSLTSSLLGNLQLGVLGIQLPGVGAGVLSILNGATAPVDQVVASTLNTLGIGLGQADVWVTGIRCDGAVLVN